MKMKALALTALATMAVATSAFASVPSGYDSWVNVEKVNGDWHKSGYSAEVNVPKVTALEAHTDGYCHEYIIQGKIGTESEVLLATPNQPGPSITEEQLEEMFRGNN